MPVTTRRQLSASTKSGPETIFAPNTATWTSATDLSPLLNSDEASRKVRRKYGSRGADVPPVHTINLGLPPEQRYVELAMRYKDQITDLIGLFDEVVETSGIKISVNRVKQIARLLLRRVYDTEQTQELRGISRATGVEMYLMVAFNVLLDLLMGCTSGGVKIDENGQAKMIHFRTLDWGMDVLRKVVVQLEFVAHGDGPVVARSVTYVGFVGVLTGVRHGLSISLNFRGLHNDSHSIWSNIMYTKTLLLVLLGFRPSIASTLRHLIIPPSQSTTWTVPSLEILRRKMTAMATTSCYLIFSDGKETMTIEKDRVTGIVQTSDVFVTATNHDAGHADEAIQAVQKTPDVTGMAELVEESLARRGCIEKCFRDTSQSRFGRSIQLQDVEKWLGTYPILNECTHYAVIMDPTEGTLRYAKRWNKPYKATTAERELYPSPWDE